MIEGGELGHGHETHARAVPSRTVVVVPAFREPTVIGDVISSLRSQGHPVVVIDDGSGDATGANAEVAGALVIRHAINLGQGAALVTGLRCALDRFQPDCLVTFDADGQHDAMDIPRLIAPILDGRADAVLGTRFGGGSAPGIPRLRRLALRTAARFSQFAHGIQLTDSHNGLRALSPVAAQCLIAQMEQPRMAHASELVSILHKSGMRLCEVPVTVRYSSYSLAKGQHLRHAFVVIWDLLLARALRK